MGEEQCKNLTVELVNLPMVVIEPMSLTVQKVRQSWFSKVKLQYSLAATCYAKTFFLSKVQIHTVEFRFILIYLNFRFLFV
jgi:hypothetical protein